jgi:hypothetical protein
MLTKLLLLSIAAGCSIVLTSLPIVVAIGGAILLSSLFDWVAETGRAPIR